MEKYFVKSIEGKLMLASRDIQVGDSIQHAATLNPMIATEAMLEGGFAQSLNYFKVIGEISPGTKWVKEGDEFDEGEVKFMEFIAMMGSDEVSYERFKEFKGDHNYISLKGPCGHFH